MVNNRKWCCRENLEKRFVDCRYSKTNVKRQILDVHLQIKLLRDVGG